VSIIIDPRALTMANDTKTNTSFRNVTLINAVRLLANMADLAVINIDGALYVSTTGELQENGGGDGQDVNTGAGVIGKTSIQNARSPQCVNTEGFVAFIPARRASKERLCDCTPSLASAAGWY